ncbi:hypothetical protein [Arenicella xantha]|uniref:Uncharacterized protein n=1 Tax=Arenicella xantha TaxID=644221 RepID=A0A395JK15_9GAMM|nr:hypothetical protein [Arenicella xantha]RBP49138.1 hypothetical protein DFR28_10464 [Arenicella xantha]
MNIKAAFLAEIKKHTWSVCTIEKGRSYQVGDNFSVVGDEGTISKVVVVSNGGKDEQVMLPIKGSLEVEATDNSELTFGFKYKSDKGAVKQFFMRFHFFCNDPAVFRFSSNPFTKGECECNCNCCCCGGVKTQYVLYSTYDDGDRGTGGPHAH